MTYTSFTNYITLHYITLHYITLHYITLHYITLHYMRCAMFNKVSGQIVQDVKETL